MVEMAVLNRTVKLGEVHELEKFRVEAGGEGQRKDTSSCDTGEGSRPA